MSEFIFHTKLDQTILLGIKAREVKGLLEGIRTVPDTSIYHHTHRFLQDHFSTEPPNDFAYWVTDVIGDSGLGEQLSSVDIVQFHSIAELREQFIALLENYLESSERLSFSRPGSEFHFMASRLFILPTKHVAQTLRDFLEILPLVSANSLYHHMFDAKLRLKKDDNDFSQWFAAMGFVDLAQELRNLDPYAYTLEGLRKRILVLVKRHSKESS